MLHASDPRCQGRTGYSMGQRVLASECFDCLRRTTPEHPTIKVRPINPPSKGDCPHKREPYEDEGALC